MNRLREGFQAGLLRVSQLETNPFEKAIEAYTKIAEKNAHETSARLWLTLIRFANRMSENLRGVSSYLCIGRVVALPLALVGDSTPL
jgi:hypothetical protein